MKSIMSSLTLLLICISLTQQLTYQQKYRYLQKLLHIQDQIQDKIQQLIKIVQKNLDNSQALKGQPDLQKTILEKGFKQRKDQLSSTYQQTFITFQQNYWQCNDLSNSEKQLITAKIKDLEDKTDAINSQIKGQNDCLRNVQLKAQLRFLQLHIQSLENELKNTCQPPRKDEKLINNLKTSKNWVYGFLSPKDYQKQVQTLKKQYNLVECDQEKPFLINNECSTCQKAAEIYSLSEQKCIEKCPTGTVFLKINHNCVDPKKTVFIPQNLDNVDSSKNQFIWGPTTEQQYKEQIKELKNTNLSIFECTTDKPFNQNSERCTSCSPGQVFNIGTQQCSYCNDKQKYIYKIHQCKQVYKKPNYDAGKNWVALNGDSKPIDEKLKDLENQNYPVEPCPPDQPFPTNDFTDCVACDKNYNLNTGSCESCNKYFILMPGKHECSYVIQTCEANQFWNGKKCLKCISPGTYDNNLRECICKQPMKYDSQTGQCLAGNPNLKNVNPEKAINFIGTAPSPNKFIQNCPDSQPFFYQKAQRCIECPLPSNYFNFDSKKCEQCPANFLFRIEQKKCVQSLEILNSNIGPNVQNYCCTSPLFITGKPICPGEKPFFDGYHCVSCSIPKYFDFKDKLCKSCPDGKEFSGKKKECVEEKLMKPKIVSNIPSGRNNYYGNVPSDQPDSEGQEIRKCPQEKPFSNGKECLSCEQPRYFNFFSSQCEICKEGFSFSGDSRQCQPNTLIRANIYNSNIVGAENFVGKVPNYKNQYPECPSDRRYFNGVECQKCQLPLFWNFDHNDCRQCDKGLYFDQEARQCLYESISQDYKTNINATNNIYYNGDFQNIKKQLSDASQKTVCPPEKPFFDKSTNRCVNCSGEPYIFNFSKNRCMKCPDGTHFNEQYHICFQNGVGPTIERMVMNSVSWI